MQAPGKAARGPQRAPPRRSGRSRREHASTCSTWTLPACPTKSALSSTPASSCASELRTASRSSSSSFVSVLEQVTRRTFATLAAACPPTPACPTSRPASSSRSLSPLSPAQPRRRAGPARRSPDVVGAARPVRAAPWPAPQLAGLWPCAVPQRVLPLRRRRARSTLARRRRRSSSRALRAVGAPQARSPPARRRRGAQGSGSAARLERRRRDGGRLSGGVALPVPPLPAGAGCRQSGPAGAAARRSLRPRLAHKRHKLRAQCLGQRGAAAAAFAGPGRRLGAAAGAELGAAAPTLRLVRRLGGGSAARRDVRARLTGQGWAGERAACAKAARRWPAPRHCADGAAARRRCSGARE